MNGKSQASRESKEKLLGEPKEVSFAGLLRNQSPSMVNIFELRKCPEMLRELMNAAEFIEKHKEGMIFEFSFSIQYNTVFGESIVVTGGTEFLGNWDPSQGLLLNWTDSGCWQVSLFLTLSSIKSFEYKYVLVGNDSMCWEAGPNRVCSLSSGIRGNSHTMFKLKDTWRYSR